MNWRLVWHATAALLIAASVWFAAESSAYLLLSRGAERSASKSFSLTMPRPTDGERILIVAPHPDDETLGCGGLIQAALQARARVRLLFMTCGDGFRVAVERQFRTAQPQPHDFVEFGQLRMQEARRAAATLGLGQADVRFLGYPDGSLTLLWRYHWSPERPLRARLTATERVPYAAAVRPGALFCASELVSILREQIAEFRPTEILTTHPADDHRDHAATAAFVVTALNEVRESEALPATGCRLRYFIVHRGDWPQPQGIHLDTRLAPPTELTGLDTHWAGLTLNPTEVRTKLKAIETYRSQTSIMGRFLRSFARTSEVFGAIQPPTLRLSGENAPVERATLVPVLLRDAEGDNLLRRWSPGDDIATVLLGQRDGKLHVSVQPARRPAARSDARVHLRWVDAHGASGALELQTRTGDAGSATAHLSVEPSGYEGDCPVESLRGAELLFVDAETRVAGLTVDRTGPRAVLVRQSSR